MNNLLPPMTLDEHEAVLNIITFLKATKALKDNSLLRDLIPDFLWPRLYCLSTNFSLLLAPVVTIGTLSLVNHLFKKAESAGLSYTSKTPIEEEYDYIIVGGGTSGCIIASRLAQATAHLPETIRPKILLIEGGYADINSQKDQLDMWNSWGSPLDWSFSTVPEPGLADRKLMIHRAFQFVSLSLFLSSLQSLSDTKVQH